MKVKEEFMPYDVAEYLKTPEDMAGYLDACLKEDAGDGVLVCKALGNIARAYGMTQLARDTGLGTERLDQALSNNVIHDFATFMKVIKTLGLKIRVSTT